MTPNADSGRDIAAATESYRTYLDDWRKFYGGQVVTLNRLQDGTRTIEIALDDAFPFSLGTTVEIRVIKGVTLPPNGRSGTP